MGKRRNTRINTLFSEVAYDWLNAEAAERSQSLAQVVRAKVELARKNDAILDRIEHLEKIIKKSHAVLVERLGGAK